MLTIENTNKLFRRDVGEWRIGKIEEISTAYLIQLNKSNGDKMQVNLERTPVKSKENLYELWMWSKNQSSYSPTPKRTMLKLNDIKDMNKLVSSIEFLIRD